MRGYTVRAIILGLSLLVATSGCLMPHRESQQVRTYRLSLDSEFPKQEAGTTNNTGAVLLVGLPQAVPGFDTQRMVYVPRQYEVSYFSANQWVDTPSHMLIPLLVTTLERTGVWRAVVMAPNPLRADYRVDVNGLLLAQEVFQPPSRVRLAWRAQLIDLRSGQVLGTRFFEAAQEAPSEDAYGGVRAANQGVATLLEEMSLWVKGCMTKPGRATC